MVWVVLCQDRAYFISTRPGPQHLVELFLAYARFVAEPYLCIVYSLGRLYRARVGGDLALPLCQAGLHGLLLELSSMYFEEEGCYLLAGGYPLMSCTLLLLRALSEWFLYKAYMRKAACYAVDYLCGYL